MTVLFTDREDAGRRLAHELKHLRPENPVVVALPRGGVPVACEVARVLESPVDVVVVRKLGTPWQPELGMGAVGEEGVFLLNRELIYSLGLTDEQVQQEAAQEMREVDRRLAAYRGGRPAVPVRGRTVILVDDGIATGFTAQTAIKVLRGRGARRVILAAPVAPAAALQRFRQVADEVVFLATPEPFWAIGQWYGDFSQVTDDQVRAALAAFPVPGEKAEQGERAVECRIELPGVRLYGDLTIPAGPWGLVIFAHGSGSSRLSPRNRSVAAALNQAGLATLLFDLLTDAEERDRSNVFDIRLLAQRLVLVTRWAQDRPDVRDLDIGYFGASTGAAAALLAAAELGDDVRAVVSRGGRPDLAGSRLPEVLSPTLLIVGGRDDVVIELNRQAEARMSCERRLVVVPGATHLFEEPGTLEKVSDLALRWFEIFLGPRGGAAPVEG